MAEKRKTSELPVNSSPSTSTTVVGVDNGETIQIPIEGIGGYGLNLYLYSSSLDNYMSEIKNLIETNGGDITKLNYVNLRGTLLLMMFTYVGGSNYYVYALDILSLKSYKYSINPATTTIADFLAKESVSKCLPLSGGTITGVTTLDTTSNTDMTTPSIDILHTGPATGSDEADLMVLAGYKSAPYGFKFRTIGDGTAVIQSQRIKGGNGEKFDLSLNPDGGKVLANGVEVATKTTATQSAAGLMSAEDKKKLDGISGGTSSGGDSSIIDLGDQPDHKDAQQTMIDHLMQMNANAGCYLFKYWCYCYSNACFAIVLCRNIDGVRYFEGTVYDNYLSYRQFMYTTNDGFTLDGCWEDIGSSSGGAGLSMPRIRLSNWEYITDATLHTDETGEDMYEGEIKFSVCIQDGTVQEGDELEICALKNTYGKYKLRGFNRKVITAEDIENLAKQPYLQFVATNMKAIRRTDSAEAGKAKPKYIRIRRPIWGENCHGEWVVVNASFSNVVPVHIGLRFERI